MSSVLLHAVEETHMSRLQRVKSKLSAVLKVFTTQEEEFVFLKE